ALITVLLCVRSLVSVQMMPQETIMNFGLSVILLKMLIKSQLVCLQSMVLTIMTERQTTFLIGVRNWLKMMWLESFGSIKQVKLINLILDEKSRLIPYIAGLITGY